MTGLTTWTTLLNWVSKRRYRWCHFFETWCNSSCCCGLWFLLTYNWYYPNVSEQFSERCDFPIVDGEAHWEVCWMPYQKSSGQSRSKWNLWLQRVSNVTYIYLLLHPKRDVNYCYHHVLTVCLSICIFLKPHAQASHFVCKLPEAVDRFSSHDSVCTSGFVDDVIFHIMGHVQMDSYNSKGIWFWRRAMHNFMMLLRDSFVCF